MKKEPIEEKATAKLNQMVRENELDALRGFLNRIVSADYPNTTEWNDMKGMARHILNETEGI